jgi:hypothetical protein
MVIRIDVSARGEFASRLKTESGESVTFSGKSAVVALNVGDLEGDGLSRSSAVVSGIAGSKP